MFHSRYGFKHVGRCVILLACAALVACAAPITARVTTYQQWPSQPSGQMDAQTYRIVPSPEQRNNLEFQAVADMVRSAIGPTGLIESQTPESARFDVHLAYGNPQEKSWEQRFVDPWGFSPFFGGFYGGRGGWGWGSGIYMGPSFVNVPVTNYKNTLTITMLDQLNDGVEVYRSTATHISESDTLMQVMPYLAQAIFDDFPGNNGQERVIRYAPAR